VLEIAYVGRLVAEKGLPLLLHAVKSLEQKGEQIKLTFIGDGPERASLTRLVRDLSLEKLVTFPGDLTGVDFDRAVSRVDVLAMPSIWEETAGLSAIEQMMRGRLVVASDIGGLGEIVDGVGLKFQPGDWRDLASRIQQVIDDPSLIESMGTAARSRAAQLFGRDAMIHWQVELCREILSR
jgi:glycogen synthase